MADTYKVRIVLRDPPKSSPDSESVVGTLTLSIKMTSKQVETAADQGISGQELQNLVGQRLQELIALLGNSDEV